MQPTSATRGAPNTNGARGKARPNMAVRGGTWRASSTRTPPQPNGSPTVKHSGGSPDPNRRDGGASPIAVNEDIMKQLKSMVNDMVEMQLKGNIKLRGRLESLEGSVIEGKVKLRDVVELPMSASPGQKTDPALPTISEMRYPISSVVRVDRHAGSLGNAQLPSVLQGSGQTSSWQTDSAIGARQSVKQRELTPWQPSGDISATPLTSGDAHKGSANKDEETFGEVTSNWDQFAANQKMFGGRTDYHDDIYTTKLDRSGADFKSRESHAQKLAEEILNSTSKNSHRAEERGQATQDRDGDEEDRYSGVPRAPNAYVPPGARRQETQKEVQSIKIIPPPPPRSIITPTEMMRSKSQAIDGQAGLAKLSIEDHDKMIALRSGKPLTPNTGNDVGVQIQNFVEIEREKLDRRRSNMVKTEKEKKLAELVSFGKSFKVAAPVPADLIPLLHRPSQSKPAQVPTDKARLPPTPQGPEPPKHEEIPLSKVGAKEKIPMVIQNIPPFGSKLAKPTPIRIPATAEQSIPPPLIVDPPIANDTAAAAAAALNKLNPTASTFVFRPNPKASTFTPSPNSIAASISVPTITEGVDPVRHARSPLLNKPTAINLMRPDEDIPLSARTHPAREEQHPFFASLAIKRTSGISVREDFNCFRAKVTVAKDIAPEWPFTGRLRVVAPVGNVFFAGPPQPAQSPIDMVPSPSSNGAATQSVNWHGPAGPAMRYPQTHGVMTPLSPGAPNAHYAQFPGQPVLLQANSHNTGISPGPNAYQNGGVFVPQRAAGHNPYLAHNPLHAGSPTPFLPGNLHGLQAITHPGMAPTSQLG